MEEDTRKYVWANRRVNILFMLLGAVEMAIEDLDVQLKANNLDLKREEKVMLRNIQQTYKSLQNGIRKLNENSIYKSKTMAESDINLHEDLSYRLYVIILAMMDRAGADKLGELRLYSLTRFIMGFKSLLNTPKLDFLFKSAFTGVVQDIQNGKYSKEDMLKLLVKDNHEED